MDLTIEELSLSAWPPLQTMVLDGWVLRFAEGYTKRPNSVNPLYASTLGLAIVVSILERAAELGASRSYLQVVSGNASAEIKNPKI